VLGDASGQDVPFSGDAAWFGSRTVTGLNLAGIAHTHVGTVHDALVSISQLITRGILDEPSPSLRTLDEAAIVHEEIENRTAPAKTVLTIG
jgi:NADPH2:quinone reductase